MILPLVFLLFAAAEQPVIAVFDLEVKGVRFDRGTLDRLNGYLIGRVVASGMFQVLPRADVKARLTAQKAESFKSCYDESCQIEIGKELAAHKSLSAQVIKVGSKCSVVLSVIDLKKAASERGASVDAACTEDAIVAALKDAVAELAARPKEVGAVLKATRCEISLAKEGCPADPARPLSFDDDFDRADKDQARCLRRALEYFDWCGSSAPVIARYYQGTELKGEQRGERKSRCEINLSAEGCRGSPNEARKRWNDDHESASSDQARCMRRALEYFDWCGSNAPVVARYFEGATMKREQRGARATRCEIEFTEGTCAASTGDPRNKWNDDHESASSDPVRCLKRAREYHEWCGSSAAVIARYFNGTKLEREERADPKTRCEIRMSEERCPAFPGDWRARWNDNHENAGSDEGRCLRRALEYYDWCGSSEPVTARFYAGEAIKREERAERQTRCEIRLPDERCPKYPYETRARFNDDHENASSTKERCLLRASDWRTYCEIRTVVVARFLSGAKVIAETTAR